MTYYSAIKRVKLLIHAKKWMNLKIIMQSKRGQTKKWGGEYILCDFIYIKLKKATNL